MPSSALPSRRSALKLIGSLPLCAALAHASRSRSEGADIGPGRADRDLIPDPSLRGLEGTSRILVSDTQDYWTLYPTAEPLSIARLERLPDSTNPGVEISLASAGLPVTGLQCEDEGDGRIATDGDVLQIWFPDHDRPEVQFHTVDVRAVSPHGEPGPSHRLRMQYVSKERDAAAGRTMFSRVIVKDTDIPVSYSFVQDWVIENPDESDRAFAAETWTTGLPADATPGERAIALARRLVREFEAFRGTPSDTMDGLHPFRQYERVLRGEDHVWCANICEVFCHAANSLDIPCRLIRMRHTYREATPGQPGADYEILTGPGHTVPEIYDADLNQWVLIDPTLRTLGFRDAQGTLLNLGELHRLINSPHQAQGLQVDAYDPTTDVIRTVPLGASDFAPNFRSYLRREQRFYYFQRKTSA